MTTLEFVYALYSALFCLDGSAFYPTLSYWAAFIVEAIVENAKDSSKT